MTEQRSVGHRFRDRPLPADDLAAWAAGKTRSVHAFRATVIAHASAAELGAGMGSWAEGSIEELGPDRCRVTFGSRSAEDLANWLTFLRCDFEVVDSPELSAAVAALAGRFARAAG